MPRASFLHETNGPIHNRIKTSHIKNDTFEIIEHLKRLNLELKIAQESPANDGISNPAGVDGFDPRIKDVNFAMTRFLETASTAIGSPTGSPRASPTDLAQASTFDGNLDDNDDSDLDRAPTLANQDNEPDIRQVLAQEHARTFMNEDGQTVLHLAASQDASLTRDVLGHGFDINLRNVDGQTALMCAVNAGMVDTVAFLLKNHADINAVDDQGATCLHLAASKNESGPIAQLLLSHNPNTEIVDGIGLTPLFLAAFNGNDAVVRQLLEFGAKPEAKEAGSFNALHYACMQANHLFMGRLLKKNGPDFEAFYDLSTYGLPTDPSHSTISKRRAQIVHSLLTHSADVHASSKGFTPMHIAALTAQEQLVSILLSHGAKATGIPVITAYWGLSPETVDLLLIRGANISATDSRHNKTALTWTAEIGSFATLEVLLRHGSNVHHQDNEGFSALHYAGAHSRNKFITLLLDAGADPNLLDWQGRTPLIRLASAGLSYLAGRCWNPSAAERADAATLLLNAGCDPSVKDVHGNLAVHYAAGRGYRGILEAIEKVGGDMEPLDGTGRTPVERAKENGEMDVVRVLKRKAIIRARGEGE